MDAAVNLRIVVVEDYPILREELVLSLNQEGYRAVGANCGEALDELLALEPADVLVLDLNLPQESGLSIAQRIRRAMPHIGIVMLTARVRGSDKVSGYEAGADLYLTKPIHPRELSAAIGNLARRLTKPEHAHDAAWQLDHRGLRLYAPEGGSVTLTASEALLLRSLALAPQQALEVHQLLSCLEQPADDAGKAKLEVLFCRLRKKLSPHAAAVPIVKAIRGRGYQLCLPIRVR
ncbi:response regulator transcription factor [Methylococcus sp. Mc7]|uniref:response regulator transcription factor n=1 Tax=Methylococcus sp. Mc7 TaxID=2860258 RepID=UPI001C534241|nr:response regulator transcription factor [Methylococcus sp. Mc7]QXP84991.1 response regulator transcription factor [Methylococcus sp. Mc7]